MASNHSTSTFADPVFASGFALYPMVVLSDRSISNAAKVVYGHLLYLTFKGTGIPRQEDFCKDVGLSIRTLRNVYAELERRGYVSVKQVGLGKPNEITLHVLVEAGKTDRQKRTDAESHFSAGPIHKAVDVETLDVDTLEPCSSVVETQTSLDSPCTVVQGQFTACEADEKTISARPLTNTQQAIQDAFTAFPLEGKATEPPGTRAKYSRLTGKIKEVGLPLVREWAAWLETNPQEVPEEADPWVYFCRRFIEAMDVPWKWHGKGNGGNGGNGSNSSQATHPAAQAQGAADRFISPVRYRGPKWQEVGKQLIEHACCERGTTRDEAYAEWDEALVQPENMEMLNLDGIWGRLRDRYAEERTGIAINRTSLELQFQYDQMAVDYGIEYAKNAYWEDHARCTGEYKPTLWVTERLAEKQHEQIGG